MRTEKATSSAVTWREILSSKGPALHDKLGGGSECNVEEKRLPFPTPSLRGWSLSMWEEACDYSETASSRIHPRLAVDRILYDEQQAALVRLRPTDTLNLDDAAKILELSRPASQHFPADHGAKFSRWLSPAPELGEQHVVDIYTDEDDNVIEVRLSRGVGWYWAHVEPFQDLLVAPGLLAPRTTSPRLPEPGIWVQLNHTQMRLHDISEVAPHRLEVRATETAAPGDAAVLKRFLAASAARAQEGRGQLQSITIVADQLLTVARADAFVALAQAQDAYILGFAGRNTPDLGAPYSQYVTPRVTSVMREKGSLSRVHVEAHVSPSGIDVRFQGERVEPVHGCPAEGPTICADVDTASARAEAARRARDTGDFARYDAAVMELIEAYRPAVFYGVLVELREKTPRENQAIGLSFDGGIPVAVALRITDVARDKLHIAGTAPETCAATLTENQLGAARPCRHDFLAVPLFPDIRWKPHR